MKNKIIIFLVLIILFAFVVPCSASDYPELWINFIVHTQGSDSSFDFTIYFDTNTPWSWWPSPLMNFSLQTENLSASKTIGIINDSYSTTHYKIVTDPKFSHISCVSDNPNEKFIYREGDVILGPSTYSENITCTFDNFKTPVLIVPGLLGTEIKEGNELLWADVDRMFTDIGDSFMDDLQFKNDLSP